MAWPVWEKLEQNWGAGDLFPHASACFYVCQGSGRSWGGEDLNREHSLFLEGIEPLSG